MCGFEGLLSHKEKSLRIKEGIQRAKMRGKKLGRPKRRDDARIRNLRERGLSIVKIARLIGMSKRTVTFSLRETKK